jgi:hypothetical protein
MSCLETKSGRIVSALLAFLLAAPMIHATILTNGQTGNASALNAGGTLLASETGTITTNTWSATFTEWVYSDPNNTFCAGCLDFVYQYLNSPNSNDVLERFTGFSYAGFKTDVGYIPNQNGVLPGLVDRSSTGAVVGFDYFGASSLLPGQQTAPLVIETDANSFGLGYLTAQDGNAGYAQGFAPAVPDPATLGLLGSGLAVVGSVLRRRNLL